MAKTQLFDILNEICHEKKGGLITKDNRKDYPAFVVNRFLAAELDCVLFANDMNLHHQLEPELQYEYLRLTIRARKRYLKKWSTREDTDVVSVVADYYGFSRQKAQSVIQLHTPDQIDYMRDRIRRGGLVGR